MSEVPQAEREFLVGAERRLGIAILALLPVGTAVALWGWSAEMALAFAFGGVLAYLNYRWIVAVVDALVRAQQRAVPRRAYARLFLPLILLGIILYVIFARSWLSPAGVLSGFSLLLLAAVAELVYQILLGLRR